MFCHGGFLNSADVVVKVHLDICIFHSSPPPTSSRPHLDHRHKHLLARATFFAQGSPASLAHATTLCCLPPFSPNGSQSLVACVPVLQDLMHHKLLHNLLLQGRTGTSPPATPATPLTTSTRGYSLRVVGHSLGAGAYLLSLKAIRRVPILPSDMIQYIESAYLLPENDPILAPTDTLTTRADVSSLRRPVSQGFGVRWSQVTENSTIFVSCVRLNRCGPAGGLDAAARLP